MIKNDEQLSKSQQAVGNLQKILLEARKVHSPQEYREMSEPILIEIQRREQEILNYLSMTKEEISVNS